MVANTSVSCLVSCNYTRHFFVVCPIVVDYTGNNTPFLDYKWAFMVIYNMHYNSLMSKFNNHLTTGLWYEMKLWPDWLELMFVL